MSPPASPSWLRVASVTALSLTLAFMMLLVVLATAFGRQVPDGSRFLVVIVLALGAGFGAAGMSGDAALKGKLPFANGVSPIAISLTNGLAVFVLVLLLRDWILPVADSGNRLELHSLVGAVAGDQPERIMVSAEYDGMAVGPDRRLVLVICRDALCQGLASRAIVDEPALGSMAVFLKEPRQSAMAGRLLLENQRTGEVQASGIRLITW